MRCPKCADNNDKVLESRSFDDNNTVRRRRECLNCGHRYTSYERIEIKPIKIHKNDGRTEEFRREKLERGLRLSLQKRSIREEDFDKLILSIEKEISDKAGPLQIINSKEVGNIILEHLYDIDRVAYIRFASVYKRFDDIDQFINEIANIKK